MKTLAAIIAVSLLLAACTPAQPAPPRQGINGPPVVRNEEVLVTAGVAKQDPSAVIDDASARQLRSICGALLQYKAAYKHLPDKLEEIQVFSDEMDPIILTCPISHQPFLYFPNTLVSSKTRRQLIVCEPTPAHKGGRYYIFMPPPEPGKGSVLIVDWMSEQDFKAFVPPFKP